MKRRTFLQRTVGAALATLTAFYVPGRPWAVLEADPFADVAWWVDRYCPPGHIYFCGTRVSLMPFQERFLDMVAAQPRLNTLTITRLTERVDKIEAASPEPVNMVLASPAHLRHIVSQTGEIPQIIRLTPTPP